MLKQLSPDLVVCAISGYEGIYSMLEAIRLKLPVAVANKEPLVIAGKNKNKKASLPFLKKLTNNKRIITTTA